MVNIINSVIGGFSSVNVVELAALTLWLQLSDYSQLSYYIMQLQLHRTINETKQKTEQVMHQSHLRKLE